MAAQEGSEWRDASPEEIAAIQTEWMAEGLGLDADQREKIEPLNLEYARRLKEIAASDQGRLKKFRALKALETEKMEALEAVFTKAQFEDFKERREALREQVKTEIKRRRSDG